MTSTRRFVTLSIVLIAVCGALVGTTISALRLRSDAHEWNKRAIAAEVELTDKRAALEAATRELATTSKLSDEYRERIDELANDKAQSGDEIALADVERAAYERIARAYSDVTLKWQACVDGHEQYEKVLADRGRYNAADVKRFVNDLEKACSEAQTADDDLRSQLSR